MITKSMMHPFSVDGKRNAVFFVNFYSLYENRMMCRRLFFVTVKMGRSEGMSHTNSV